MLLAKNGLTLIHKLRSPHFSIKPENILKCGTDKYKIADFGFKKI